MPDTRIVFVFRGPSSSDWWQSATFGLGTVVVVVLVVVVVDVVDVDVVVVDVVVVVVDVVVVASRRTEGKSKR